MTSACGYTWDTFCILFKAGSAPVPIAQSWILQYGPLHRMILKKTRGKKSRKAVPLSTGELAKSESRQNMMVITRFYTGG
jgi:hypothetical protein